LNASSSGLIAVRLTLWLVVLGLLLSFTAQAQDDVRNHPWAVYTRRDAVDAALRELIFMDLLTGDLERTPVYGARFTVAGPAVVYWDTRLNRVRMATPDGAIEDHPFIQADDGAYRVDWVFAPDHKHVAWTLTFRDGGNRLTTVTRTAKTDGSDVREVLREGPRDDGLRVHPVAFDSGSTRLYMDYQPDGLSELTAFPQYAGLFTLDLATGTTAFLPDEPGNFTGAGFGAGFFLRLALNADQNGFDLRVYDLDRGQDWIIPSLRLRGYTQAGDLLVSPNGRYAVYALASITGFGTASQQVNTLFVLVDLITMEQQPLTEPITTFVRPAAWTEDNTAVIFTSPQLDGTWKVTLTDRTLKRIAEPTFRGTLQLTLSE
jgi:hypothetical protein